MTAESKQRLISQIKTVISTIESGQGDTPGQRRLLVELIDLFVVSKQGAVSNRFQSFYHLRVRLDQVGPRSKEFLEIAKEIVGVLDGLVAEETETLESVLPPNLEALVADYEQALAEAKAAKGKNKKIKLRLAEQKLGLVQAAINKKKQLWHQEQLSRRLAKETEGLTQSQTQTENKIDEWAEQTVAELVRTQPEVGQIDEQKLGLEIAEVLKSDEYLRLVTGGVDGELAQTDTLIRYLRQIWQAEPSKFGELNKLAAGGGQYLAGLASRVGTDKRLKKQLGELEAKRELAAGILPLKEGLAKVRSETERDEKADNTVLVEGYKQLANGARQVDQTAAAQMFGGVYELAGAIMGPGAETAEVQLLAEEMFEASLETIYRVARQEETGQAVNLPDEEAGEEYKARFADEFEKVWRETLKQGQAGKNVRVTDALHQFSEASEGVSAGQLLVTKMPEKVWWPARLLSVLSGGRLSPTLAKAEQVNSAKAMVGGHGHSLAGYFVMGLVSSVVDEVFVDDEGNPTGAGHGVVAMVEYGPGVVKYLGKPVSKLGGALGQRLMPAPVRRRLKTGLKGAWTNRLVVPALERVERATGSKILSNIYAARLAPAVVHHELKNWRLYRWLIEYNKGTNRLYFRPLQIAKRRWKQGAIWVRTGWNYLKRTAVGRAASAVIKKTAQLASKAVVIKTATLAAVKLGTKLAAKAVAAIASTATAIGSVLGVIALIDMAKDILIFVWRNRKILWSRFKKLLGTVGMILMGGVAALGMGLGGMVSGGLIGTVVGGLVGGPLGAVLGGGGGALVGGIVFKGGSLLGLGGGGGLIGGVSGLISSVGSGISAGVSALTSALGATTITSTAMIAGVVGGTILGAATLAELDYMTIQTAFILPQAPDLEQQSEFLRVSKHVEIDGHVDPATALPNTVITEHQGPLYANYQIKVEVIDPLGKLTDGVLKGVVVTMDRVSVYQGGKVTNVTVNNLNGDLGDLRVGETREVTYQLLMKDSYQDSMITNEAVVTAMAGTQRASANRSFVIGQPPELPPSGWPLRTGCISQGPGGAYSHQGVQAVDIGAPLGTPVYATHDGVVEATGYVANGYGKYVKVRGVFNGKPYYTIYAHLLSINVRAGERVRGPWLFGWGATKLGTVDSTGNSTNNHLHYEFRGLIMGEPYIPKKVPACSGSDCPQICI